MTLADTLTLISLIVPILVPLGMALYQRLLEGLPSAKRAVVSELVDNAVTAVEQMVGSGSGPLKKQNATALVEAMLKARHINVPAEEVSALIECSVAALNEAQAGKPRPMGFSAGGAPAATPAPAQTLEAPQPAPTPAGMIGLVKRRS